MYAITRAGVKFGTNFMSCIENSTEIAQTALKKAVRSCSQLELHVSPELAARCHDSLKTDILTLTKQAIEFVIA